jgi:hypothetical protein
MMDSFVAFTVQFNSGIAANPFAVNRQKVNIHVQRVPHRIFKIEIPRFLSAWHANYRAYTAFSLFIIL